MVSRVEREIEIQILLHLCKGNDDTAVKRKGRFPSISQAHRRYKLTSYYNYY